MNIPDDDQIKPCAEVVQSSLDSFTAHCWQWDIIPSFGSLVITKDKQYTTYGVVYDSKTETLDPMHSVHVYKKTEEEMCKEYPHLFDFLKTTCNVFVLGYEQSGHIFYTRAPFPVRLYSFVSLANIDETRNFFSNQHNMSRLTHEKNILPRCEDILFALIVQQKQLGLLSLERLTFYASQYEITTQATYQQLQYFIERIETM